MPVQSDSRMLKRFLFRRVTAKVAFPTVLRAIDRGTREPTIRVRRAAFLCSAIIWSTYRKFFPDDYRPRKRLTFSTIIQPTWLTVSPPQTQKRVELNGRGIRWRFTYCVLRAGFLAERMDRLNSPSAFLCGWWLNLRSEPFDWNAGGKADGKAGTIEWYKVFRDARKLIVRWKSWPQRIYEIDSGDAIELRRYNTWSYNYF